MAQQPPAHDETVRMRPDGPDSRPPVEASPGTSGAVDTPGPQNAFPAGGEVDDTRPVPRDWLSGAPEAETAAVAEPPAQPGVEDTGVLDGAALPHASDDRADGDATDDGGSDDGGSGGAGDDGLPPAGDGADRAGSPWWRRRAVLVPAGAVLLLGAVYGADLALSSGDVPRSTVVAGVEIGGLSPAAAEKLLAEELGSRVAADRTIVADDVEGLLSPTRAGFRLDAEETVDAADDQPLNPWTRLTTLFTEREVEPVVGVDESAVADELGSFEAQLATFAEQVDRAPADATIAIDGTTARVVEPLDGRTLDRDGAEETITAALTSADPGTPVELPVSVEPASVDTPEAERVLAETVQPALAAPVEVTGDGGNRTAEVPVTALAAALTFTPGDAGTLEVGIDPAALQNALGDELAVFGSPARDARFEVTGGSVRIVPSVDGTGIDPTHLAEQLLPVLDDPAPRSVTAEPRPVPADFTTQEAEALGIREQISTFTTNIGNPASGENIRVVAAEVDGALVLPGETFSLNTFTGPRGKAQGYVEAAVIQNGELSKAVGGGISQFATTMFNAVFFAGLEDVFHKPHSFYISRYPAGREATVYEGAIDLQWRNDGDTGVFIDTQWTPSALTVTFYGTKRYEIESVSSERRNPRQPAVIDKIDDGNCTRQSGVPGFDITVTRVFKDLSTGAVVKREDFRTRYNAEAVINCVPPDSPAPPAAPEGTAPAGAPAPGGRRPGGRRVR
ncbi:Vancomycin resistance protein YoaR, contains peptidoglycan-binding and VanW domains [Blastococcus aggregatus]|uniref:Vancomycin resistance protein YoaR, contains peptidoglycan-binding and VanW domains n=1 Tax=Blastococcus aggregatus TaxID=38502 RepID=A0A285V7S5_9ACTN|nr:VanW family protein [Blastococcus aggregatus]SOC50129.1 Vancomycin resistance protein YoaR, contains peptidoglycan-binding and VanW domains [Blastococcus aggregatus]